MGSFCFPFPPLSGFLPSAPPHGQSRQTQQAPGSRRRFRDQIRRHGSLMKYSNHFSLRTTPERSRRIATDHITKLKVENMTEQEKNRPRESRDWRADGKKSRRRPTLAGPVVRLPLARQRFTSGFGTGPGGTTALWPPGFRGKICLFLHPACPGALLFGGFRVWDFFNGLV